MERSAVSVLHGVGTLPDGALLMTMNADDGEFPVDVSQTDVPREPAQPEAQRRRYFDRTDWLGFGLCALMVLGVYLWTLAPEVTLEYSGIYATGAMYPGVSMPPGYPLWSLYGWLFTRLLPFSTIAWRTAVASATAGALTCGFVALLVSRLGADLLDGMAGFSLVNGTDRKRIRLVCGFVAGGAIGFAGTFWPYAIIAESWPLTMMTFSWVLCLLTKWSQTPDRMRPLYWAAFIYGATLTTSQSLGVAMLGLEFFALFVDRELGRDLLFGNGVLLTGALVLQKFGLIDAIHAYVEPLRGLYAVIAAGSFLIAERIAWRTSRLLSRWKTLLRMGACFLLGAAIYLLIPIISMTNPPMNWGYPRTVEGFFHVLTRGQFERLRPNYDAALLMRQLMMYMRLISYHFGLLYLVPTLILLCGLHKMRSRERNCVLGFVAVFLCTSLLMIVLLNPSPELRPQDDLSGIFFSPSHLILAMWSGLGLCLIAAKFAARVPNQKNPPSSA